MAKPDKKEKNNKEKKRFFKDFKAELKKVNWPTAKQLLNNTTAVITIVLVTAIIVFVLDLAFEALNTYGINKLRNLVPTNTSTVEEQTSSEENVEVENSVTSEETETVETENNVEEQAIEE